tara:strand:+ start:6743 stop:7951 length:1209 start_codon:yes stop_codon:yes gene_type:complete
MLSLKNHSRLALIYFLLAALFGVVLRAFYTIEIPINYRFVVHGHSHIALLGWVYVALTTLIYKTYIDQAAFYSKYRYIFWFTQITIVGMLVTFPFMGYKVFSIIFSTLFLFASYGFTWFVLKHSKKELKDSNSFKCVKIAVGYMVLSSLGPWALGAIMSTLGTESVWYRMAIYFYLHFQYNGWMVLALIGLLLYLLEKNNIQLSKTVFNRFFWSFNLGVIFTFSLSTLWVKPSILFNVIGGLGSFIQISAIFLLAKYINSKKGALKQLFSNFQFKLLATVSALLLIKMMLQLITSIPFFANLAATYIDFTIGYLHWTFLGVVTLSLFLLLDYYKLLHIPRAGYIVYITGFIVTEILIFYKGLAGLFNLQINDGYFLVLSLGSVLIPLSIIVILFTNLKVSQT